MKSLQQLAADTPSPHIGVDKDHGHVAIAGDDRSSTVLRATGFSQCHRHHVPVCVEVADDKARPGSATFSQIRATRSMLGGRSLATLAALAP